MLLQAGQDESKSKHKTLDPKPLNPTHPSVPKALQVPELPKP